MGKPRRYRKKPDLAVIAIPLDLDTEGFVYRKWGDLQHCKRGDWIVNNRGEIYTVDRAVFERTYRQLQPGLYLKITPVWAEVASQAGSVTTKEGRSHYRAGDYVVYNDEGFADAYCMTAAEFEAMYEPDD
ncbi:hypothetical protein [Synechococcus sp. PCC 7336]|uniref:hypothetical protein n=1 Tax=Synechococcus sp. PCC 7336 TaxID=195250 RepID=UPI00035EFE23|nr:hypothetical protein [Synechococcus sp. PCC 7336]